MAKSNSGKKKMSGIKRTIKQFKFDCILKPQSRTQTQTEAECKKKSMIIQSSPQNLIPLLMMPKLDEIDLAQLQVKWKQSKVTIKFLGPYF